MPPWDWAEILPYLNGPGQYQNGEPRSDNASEQGRRININQDIYNDLFSDETLLMSAAFDPYNGGIDWDSAYQAPQMPQFMPSQAAPVITTPNLTALQNGTDEFEQALAEDIQRGLTPAQIQAQIAAENDPDEADRLWGVYQTAVQGAWDEKVNAEQTVAEYQNQTQHEQSIYDQQASAYQQSAANQHPLVQAAMAAGLPDPRGEYDMDYFMPNAQAMDDQYVELKGAADLAKIKADQGPNVQDFDWAEMLASQTPEAPQHDPQTPEAAADMARYNGGPVAGNFGGTDWRSPQQKSNEDIIRMAQGENRNGPLWGALGGEAGKSIGNALAAQRVDHTQTDQWRDAQRGLTRDSWQAGGNAWFNRLNRKQDTRRATSQVQAHQGRTPFTDAVQQRLAIQQALGLHG